MRIHQLPLSLTNQIAAGEVIERPASVIKELVENSLDANSNSIYIDVVNSGIDCINVRDNGCGIHQDDLELALNAHATSKIYHLEDLKNINTLGFRGEALASISAVSHFSLSSRTAQQNIGVRLEYYPDQEQAMQIAPHSIPTGTIVQAKKLFFNTPARRKFLRTTNTELYHIELMVKRFILSHHDIHFGFKSNDKCKLTFPAAQSEQQRLERVKRIFSKKFIENSVFIDRHATGMHLWGWAGLAEFQRSQTDLQYFYLNRRIIRDRIISHAIRQSYVDQLYPGRQPTYLLYLEIEPTIVDVNVHPTKNEVRFHEERMVHDFITSTLHHALKQSAHAYGSSLTKINKPQQSENTNSYNLKGSAKKYSSASFKIKEHYPNQIKIQDKSNKLLNYDGKSYPLGEALALLDNKFIISQTKAALIICDYQRAITQLRYLKLAQQFLDEGIIPRKLHVPIIVRINQNMISTLKNREAMIEKLAVELDVIDQYSLVVRKIPACLQGVDIKALVLRLANYLAKLKNDDFNQAIYQTILFSIARYTDEIVDYQLSALNQILRKLEKHQCPDKTFDGQTIFQTLATEQLAGIISG